MHAIVEPVAVAEPPTEDELPTAARQQPLASYKVPKSFELIDQLPRTRGGEVDREALDRERDATQ